MSFDHITSSCILTNVGFIGMTYIRYRIRYMPGIYGTVGIKDMRYVDITHISVYKQILTNKIGRVIVWPTMETNTTEEVENL